MISMAACFIADDYFHFPSASPKLLLGATLHIILPSTTATRGAHAHAWATAREDSRAAGVRRMMPLEDAPAAPAQASLASTWVGRRSDGRAAAHDFQCRPSFRSRPYFTPSASVSRDFNTLRASRSAMPCRYQKRCRNSLGRCISRRRHDHIAAERHAAIIGHYCRRLLHD